MMNINPAVPRFLANLLSRQDPKLTVMQAVETVLAAGQ
jgi:hypothetical protein